MFCPKCGTKALEGAEFCQKCGARLIADSTPAQPKEPTAPSNPIASSANTPKKKSKKPLVILSVIAVAVAAIIVIALNWEGEIDYEATVRAYTPFANSQGIPYTCGEVFGRYLPDAKWSVSESDNAAYVDISGTAKGTSKSLAVTMKVSENSQDADLVSFSLVSAEVDGRKLTNEGDIKIFMLALFAAYGKGYEDLSDFGELLDETEYAVRHGNDRTPSNTGAVNSIEEARKLVEDWLDDHPMGPMAGAGTGAAANDEPAISATYFVLELWEAPREFCGLVYVRKSDGYMTFHNSITDEEYDLDTWYESVYRAAANGEEHDLTFRGVSLTDWIGGPADTAYDVFGWPDYGTVIDETLYSGGEYFGYNVGFDSGVSFVIDYQTDQIGWITGAAEAIEVNGVTLDMPRAELIDLLGVPESEETISDELEGTEYYAMRYTIKGLPVEISMPNIDSAATAVLISQAA